METYFGTTPEGAEAVAIPLHSGGLGCEIISYGAALRALTVPDRDGRPVDVLLGFDTLEDYIAHRGHFGGLIGRFGNRIAGAAFDLNGVHYTLAANNRKNHLHGGPGGFDRQVWTVEETSETAVTLLLVSPDGQEGYPGTLRVRVTYTLADGALRIDYRAVSDRDTLCNLTNHAYFNLDGHDSGSVEGQRIRLFADAYTPTDADSIPTGELAPVAGTPMDLREPTPIGAHIDDDFEQLRFAGGYDHNFVIRGFDGSMRPAATAWAEKSGVVMDVETDQPGVQFYTSNSMNASMPAGKGGVRYARRQAFCLETQVFPDAPHHDNFPSAVLKAGEEYKTSTVYRFSLA